MNLEHSKDKNNSYWQNMKLSHRQNSDRPALVISSTSWTADEDFGILLEAIKVYEKSAQEIDTLPYIVFIITGKGPMKAHYEAKIKQTKLRKVRIVTKWLSNEDYPRLLGNSDS